MERIAEPEKRSQGKNIFLVIVAKAAKKIWSTKSKIKNLNQKFYFELKFDFLIKLNLTLSFFWYMT